MNAMDDQLEDLDFRSIAANWYAALSPTGFSPHSYEDVIDRLTDLTRKVTIACFKDDYSSGDGESIGRSLAELNYVQGDAIGISIKLLFNFLSAECPTTQQISLQQRLIDLVGDIANGYFKGATLTILNHQESIREAQLSTLHNLHHTLLEETDLHRTTAERLQTLHDVESGILGAQTAEAIAKIAVSHLIRIIPCYSALIASLNRDRGGLVVLASTNTPQKPGDLLSLSVTTQERIDGFVKEKSILINDLGALENRVLGLENAYRDGLNAILNVPLLSKGILIGILSLQSREVGAFVDHHVEIAQQIADSVAVALYNQQLLEAEKLMRQESGTLRELAAGMSSSLDREQLLEYILTQLENVLPHDGAFILLQTDGNTELAAQRGIEPTAKEILDNMDQLPLNMQRLIKTKMPVIIPDTDLDPDWLQIPGTEYIRCWLGVPLISQGELIGLLALDKREANFYGQSEADLVLAFANHAAIAIENARLYQTIQNHAETLREHVEARTRELSSLYEIASITNQYKEIQDLLNEALLIMLDDLGFPAGAVHILDGESGEMHLAAHRNQNPAHQVRIEQIGSDSGILQRILAMKEPVLSIDRKISPEIQEAVGPAHPIFSVGTVMRVGGEVVGLLSMHSDRSLDLTEEQTRLFVSIADHLALAIEKLELRKQAEQLAVMEERERLARDLHDSVTQSLFSLILFAAAAREQVNDGHNERALQHLDDIRITANQAHRELRLLLYELGNPEPAEEDLVQALQRRLRTVEGRSGINAAFHPQLNNDLSTAEEEVFYQIATEALNNALKHAEATSVTVELFDNATHTVMIVKDNGKGFDLSEARQGPGMGLTNMKMRAGTLAGQLTITSAASEGTVISVKIPRKQENRLI